jgi:hypothetical protein
MALGTGALTACKVTPTAGPGEPSSSSSSDSGAGAAPSPTPSPTHRKTAPGSSAGTRTASPTHSTTKPHRTTSTTAPADTGPRIVSFRIAQKPKCAEGTAVFRAEAVPLIIKWKITGATGGALSVDDNTHTAGTYGPVDLEGSEEFAFTCRGAVGSTETHTYAIYTVGGGEQHSRTLKASAKVLDLGKP